MTKNNIGGSVKDTPEAPVFDPQFTWLETLLIPYITLLYLASWGVVISIIVEKFRMDEKTSTLFLYTFFFVFSHVLAGVKNLQFHFQEVRNKGADPNWIVYMLFLPFSPSVRYFRAWMFGRKEGRSWEGSVRFIDECITASVLRMFDTVLGEAPIVVLLLQDDIWNRSSDWQLHMEGSTPAQSCYPECDEIKVPNIRWPVGRLVFLVAQISLNFSFYNMMTKRRQHLEHPKYFDVQLKRSVRTGRVNVFGSLVMFGSNFTFISSRLLGYSLVATVIGFYAAFLISLRWIMNAVWNFATSDNTKSSVGIRFLSSLSWGGVWLLGLTNTDGGRQLGRYLIHFSIAGLETLVCCVIWFVVMRGSSDYFTKKAIWTVLIFFFLSLIITTFYYSACHPSSPSLSRKELLCCTQDRRPPFEHQDSCTTFQYEESAYNRHSTLSAESTV